MGEQVWNRRQQAWEADGEALSHGKQHCGGYYCTLYMRWVLGSGAGDDQRKGKRSIVVGI